MESSELRERVEYLPNNARLVHTRAGDILVNSPPESLKFLLALGHDIPRTILLPPDIPAGSELGSSGFVRRGINYASVEFLLYSNFFVHNIQTRIITPTRDQAKRMATIISETLVGPMLPGDYGSYQWLQSECMATSYYPPLGHEPQLENLADLRSLEEGGGVLDDGVMIELQGREFVFFEGGFEVARVPIAITEPASPLILTPPRPVLRHELTLQFIGGSDGFDPAGITTCFIAFLDPKHQTRVTLFDTAAYLRQRLGNLGISPYQISEVVLSHLHEDHLAGLPELLLMGNSRIRLLTSTIIYQSLLRVLGAIMDRPTADVAALFDHIPLDPGEPIDLEGRTFEAMYAVHTIPTIAVRVGDLYYSGDMRYDENWFEELVDAGILNERRRHELTSFAENAKVIVQDAGGGAVHTTITPDILGKLAAEGRRVILAHTSTSPLAIDEDMSSQVEIAGSGHVSNLGSQVLHSDEAEYLATISASPLFARLSIEERRELTQQAVVKSYKDGEAVVMSGNPSDGWGYVVHSGLIDLWTGGKMRMIAGRGSSFGERGALTGGNRRQGAVARGDVKLLALSEEILGPVAARGEWQSAFERADWLAQLPLFSDLLWSALLDLALDLEPQSLSVGEQLFSWGETGDAFYLTVSGNIAIVDRNNYVLDEIHSPGVFFGGRSALFDTVRNASAFATEASEIWALPVQTLERLQIVYPEILLHLRAIESSRSGELPPGAEARPYSTMSS